MDRKTVLCRLATIAIFTLGIYSAAAKSFAAAPQIPVEVQVFTTMPSTDAVFSVAPAMPVKLKSNMMVTVTAKLRGNVSDFMVALLQFLI